MHTLSISLTACLGYMAAVYLQYQHLRNQKRPFSKQTLITLGLMALSFHGYLLYRWIDTPTGQNLSLSHVFSLIAWLSALFTLMATSKKPIENLTLITLPLALVSIPLAVAYPGHDIFQTRLNMISLTHILISIIAFGIFMIATLQALLLHVQTRRLKTRSAFHPPAEAINPKGASILFFPPLETMEFFLFQTIWLGFLFLSASVATAFCLSSTHSIASPISLSKIIPSLLSWIVFASLLYGHQHWGWRGRKAIRWTLLGSGLLIVAYLGRKLILLE